MASLAREQLEHSNNTMKDLRKHLLSFVLPITVLIIVPLTIEPKARLVVDLLFVAGIFIFIAGVSLLAVTVSSFIRIGKGTLAPWSPTKNLVVGGVYAYVRNPMITGVLTALLGESFIAHSVNIYIWAILFYAINTIYFLISEEPGLEKRFGTEYREYRKNVPRWIPRFTPWRPESD